MPTYAYACTSCGHRFDIYQAFSDDALSECPECGGALRKQFGNVGVMFKGSGFYRNDARGTTSSSDGSSSGTSTSESGSSTSTSTTGSKEKSASTPSSSSSSSSTGGSSSSSSSKAAGSNS